MKYTEELRSERLAAGLADRIRRRVTRPWTLMEICGGQTHTIMKFGLRQLLPEAVRLVHGPGCPVCVTPLEVLDRAMSLAALKDVVFVSYGDMLRVPGSRKDLLTVRAEGGDVRVVYSPAEAVNIAAANPDRNVVFFAIGFETTAPANAMAVKLAHARGIDNFSMLVSHVMVPPAIRFLADREDNEVQGYIAPGHVCTVTGMAPYEALCAELGVPFVVGGFEPVDVLEAVAMLVDQLEDGRAEVENQYVRSATRAGNPMAQAAVEEVFEPCDRAWRGVGTIPASGLRIKPALSAYDASVIFDVEAPPMPEPDVCIAADILLGRKVPTDCSAFGTTCRPDSPLGAPMVSSEGACAAYHRFRRV